MEKLFIGKYVNTHGIKGEIRIKSNFKYKDKIFKKNNSIFIDDKEFIINSYRVHKDYDMVTLDGINDINDILYLKGKNVYVDKSKIIFLENEYLDSDIIGYKVMMNDKDKGYLNKIEYLSNKKKLLIVNDKLVPFELVKKIDFKNKVIFLEEVDNLL